MKRPNSKNAFARSDRVLMAALAIVLATASAAIGSAVSHPYTDQPAAAQSPADLIAAQVAAETAATLKDSKSDAPMTRLLAEHKCLSEVMYYEARGEGAQGQKAIADVVFHRMQTGNYGHSICAVVYEGASQSVCQFSFTCSGEMLKKKSPGAWREAQMLAAQILTNEVQVGGITGGATNFHAVSVQPLWADDLQRTVQIGNHVFYRNGTKPHNS